MFRIWILFFAFCLPHFGSTKEVSLSLGSETPSSGMFSIFSYIIGVLHHYENSGYSGLEVDFKNSGFYFDAEKGYNWWEYYCEPIRLGSKEDAEIKTFNFAEYLGFSYFTELLLNAEQISNLIQKYIRVKPHILEKAESYFSANFSPHPIIAVHYRGTDKITETPRIPYELVTQSIRNYLETTKPEIYKIFLATDEKPFVDYLRNEFDGKVITYSTLLSADNTPLHKQQDNRYLHGEEALIDCLLLSKGDILIRTSSNLSLWSTYFNPHIPVIELSSRF